jgi:hypothetical protein
MKKKCKRHILYVCYLNEARPVVLLGDVLEEENEQSNAKHPQGYSVLMVVSSLLLTSVKKSTSHYYQESESRDFKFII